LFTGLEKHCSEQYKIAFNNTGYEKTDVDKTMYFTVRTAMEGLGITAVYGNVDASEKEE
jgi:hypothetical protein